MKLAIKRAWLRFVASFRCPHQWRPAALSVNRQPYVAARVCKLCDKMEVMQIAQFYAQFGRMPW